MSVENRYNYLGEAIPAKEFNTPKELEFFGRVVYSLWIKDQSTQQEDFDGEVWHQRVNPLVPEPTSEQLHLKRDCEHTLNSNKVL